MKKFNLKVEFGRISDDEQSQLPKEFEGNIWKWIGKAAVICIPTNNYITNGRNVMGAGLAREALMRYPNLDKIMGDILVKFGFYPYSIKVDRRTHIMNFPVKPNFIIANDDKSNIVSHAKNKYKPGDKVPGFHSIACLETIRKSAKYFSKIVDVMGDRWPLVIIPRIGTGYGEMSWEPIKKVLIEEKLYDKPNVHFIYKE